MSTSAAPTMSDPRIREVYVWRWMMNRGSKSTHPVGVGPSWNEKKSEQSALGFIEAEALPVFADIATGQPVRASCQSLLDVETGNDLGTFVVDESGRLLVLTGSNSAQVPQIEADPEIATMLSASPNASEFSPMMLLMHFNDFYKLPDGKRIFSGRQPQAGATLQCGETVLIKSIDVSGVNIQLYMKQLLVGPVYTDIYKTGQSGGASAPADTAFRQSQTREPVDPPPVNLVAESIEKEKKRAETMGVKKHAGRLVLEVTKGVDGGFLNVANNLPVDPSSADYGYIVDASTGAYLINSAGLFFKVDMGSGQAQLIKPPPGASAPAKSDDSGSLGETLFKGAVIVGGLFIAKKILSGK